MKRGSNLADTRYHNKYKILTDRYHIQPELVKIAEDVIGEIRTIFERIDNIAEFNHFKVIEAMKQSYLRIIILTVLLDMVIMIWEGKQ